MDKQKRLEIGRPEVLQVGTETRPIVYLEKMENPDYFVFITTPTETYVERSLNNSHFSVAKIFLQTLWKIPDDKVDYFLHKSKLNFKNLFLQSSLEVIRIKPTFATILGQNVSVKDWRFAERYEEIFFGRRYQQLVAQWNQAMQPRQEVTA